MAEIRKEIEGENEESNPSEWKIRRVLAEPDVALNRMFKFKRIEAEHIFQNLDSDLVQRAKEGGDGVVVKMMDFDTGTEHKLTFRKVRRGNVYGFVLGWVTHFVVRRRLKVGEEIGIYVDPISSIFHFCVISAEMTEMRMFGFHVL